jgi:hypothetical protein
MTKKEFYIVAFIVIYTYLAIIFQINVKNFIALQRGEPTKVSFNAFK